jgi:predicted DNA-binding WGR domain protein
MSAETHEPKAATGTESPAEETAAPRTAVTLHYQGASQLAAEGGEATLALVGDRARPPVRARGEIKDPLRLREALSALHDVVSQDHRFIPKDRTAYLAYMRLKKQVAGIPLWEAQRAYVDFLQQNDPLAFAVLDPIVSVHPDEVFFEVFSKDEGSYAKLGVDWSAIATAGGRADATFGTTNIDFSQALYDGVQRMRSYRATHLTIGPEQVGLATDGAPEVIEKKIQVPDAWLRGFLQVQSAGALPRTVFRIAPIDLYNVLRHLRLHADVEARAPGGEAPAEKGKRPTAGGARRGGRGMRVELVPGEPPRLVLEPWEVVIPTTAGIYTGRTAEVVRVWGRRRLMVLRRLLPFVESIEVHLLGSGMPSFYVLRAGALTFTLGLSGFTSANWAQAVSFDLLLPRRSASEGALARVLDHLAARWSAPASEVATALGLGAPEVLAALQVGCQQGKLMFDVAREVYRYRPLTAEPVDPARFAFRNARERRAHDLIARPSAVAITTENRIHGVGLELTGKVMVAADKREYRPQLLVDDEGRVKKADCTCAFFRKHQLKEGPCEHLIALRIKSLADEAARRAARGSGDASLTMETRTYARRDAAGEEVYQVALAERRLKVRWGRRGEESRLQSLVFASVEDARAAYFTRVQELERRGFLDATAGA